MRNRLFVSGFLVLALAAPSLFSQDGPPPSAPAGQGEHAHRPLPKPVNLKVLPKDIKPEELIKIMRGYAGSLGVECNFCHQANPPGQRGLNFASDAKPEKATARTMMAMTRTINEQYMSQVHDPDAKPEDQHVTCGTCHRGHSMPEHFVPPPEEHHHPPQGGAEGQHPPQ
ncbi:MAG: c-type cytochrome [Acidobacteriota bacterium]